MEKEWIKVYTTTNFFQAELVKHLLEEHNIASVLMNKQDSSYRFGQIELYTHEKDKNEALTIINELNEENHSPEE